MSDQDANRGRDVFNTHDELDAYLGRSQAATPGQSVANMIVEAARMTEATKTEPAKRRCKHGTYIPHPGTCPLCEEILRNEEPTQGQSIDSLNASLAAMNKALKELRAAGFSIEVYGGYGDVSYHMSGGVG